MAEENPDLNVKFIHTQIEKFLPTIQTGEFDLVLGMSIFRDLYKSNSAEQVRKLFADLSKKIPAFVLEPETQREPSLKSENFLAGYVEVLNLFPVIRLLSQNVADNAGAQRSLYFTSHQYIYFRTFDLLKIDSFHNSNMPGYSRPDRRYYFCGDKFVKYALIWEQEYFDLVQREIKFLQKFGGSHGFPKLYAAEYDQDEFGLRFFIVREKFEGVSLADKMVSGENFNRWNVIKQILEQLVFLEKHGYYNGEAMSQNFLVDNSEKVYTIDYERMVDKKTFSTFPYDLLQSFFLLMNDVLENATAHFGVTQSKKLLRHLKRHISKKKYYQIMAIKDTEKYFARLYEILFESDDEDEPFDGYTAAENEILAIENFMETEFKNQSDKIEALIRTVLEQQQRIEKLEKLVGEARRE